MTYSSESRGYRSPLLTAVPFSSLPSQSVAGDVPVNAKYSTNILDKNSSTTKQEIYRAINQLTALVIGGRFARATTQYQKNPKERIEHCYQLTISEQADSFGDFNKKNQVQRKVDSLYSLNLLAQLANEVEWD